MDLTGALGRVLLGDTAAVLGGLGRAVEDALTKLRAAPVSGREAAEYACAEAVWRLFVQREACGLGSHEHVVETYGIPRTVLAKIGARRPPSQEA